MTDDSDLAILVYIAQVLNLFSDVSEVVARPSSLGPSETASIAVGCYMLSCYFASARQIRVLYSRRTDQGFIYVDENLSESTGLATEPTYTFEVSI